MTMARQDLGRLALCLAVTLAAGGVGALASVDAASFYAALARPRWAPSGTVFAPVWTVLYVLMAVAAFRVWRHQRSVQVPALYVFAVQLILNAVWSWLFFRLHDGAAAFVDIVLLWIAIVTTIVLFWRADRIAGVLLVPYLLWVSFALCLNLSVWRLNPELL
jgi:tryptophan-rich sensory protein